MFFQYIRRLGWISLLILLGLVACGSKDDMTLFIGPEIVGCEGQGVRHCFQTKSDLNEAEWTLYPNPIEEFEYEQGFVYEILVAPIVIENEEEGMVVAEYVLIEVVSKVEN